MPIPSLQSKGEVEAPGAPRTVSPEIVAVIEAAKVGRTPPQGSKIVVSEIVSRLSFFYEKLRNFVDYREEHLLRKNAIQRILRRLYGVDAESIEIATSLAQELIHARYFENDSIPESRLKDIAAVLTRYRIVAKKIQNKSFFEQFFLPQMSVEIEAIFVPAPEEKLLVDAVKKEIRRSFDFSSWKLHQDEINEQLEIGIRRAIFKSDSATVAFYLLSNRLPAWFSLTDENADGLIAESLEHLHAIHGALRFKLQLSTARHFKRMAMYYQALRDVIIENPETAYSIFSDQKASGKKIKEIVEIRYKQVRARLRRSIGRSIVYIFLTKMALALLLEIPYDVYIVKDFTYLPIAINALFAPLFMFLLGITARVPGPKNTAQIVGTTSKILSGEPLEKVPVRIRVPARRTILTTTLFSILYVATFYLVFGTVVRGLRQLHFSAMGIVLFMFFFTIVSFFGWRLRQGPRELSVLERKPNFFTFLWDFVSLPFLRAGRWISTKSQRINVFLFMFDFIIEAPFKVFLEIFEDFARFFREKKEEIE